MNDDVTLSVPIARTSLLEDEILSVLAPLRSGWLVQGPQVREFERKWSAFTGAPHSIAVTSCTSALHLSLAALGFGPGDERMDKPIRWLLGARSKDGFWSRSDRPHPGTDMWITEVALSSLIRYSRMY